MSTMKARLPRALTLGISGRTVMAIETIHLSEKAKTQLLTLKRKTGIQHWNTLCRWAFCASIAEDSIPPEEDIPSDSSVEMTWRTFGGIHADTYLALLRERANRDAYPLGADNELYYFRLHLHRGISYLSSGGNITSILSLLRCAK